MTDVPINKCVCLENHKPMMLKQKEKKKKKPSQAVLMIIKFFFFVQELNQVRAGCCGIL